MLINLLTRLASRPNLHRHITVLTAHILQFHMIHRIGNLMDMIIIIGALQQEGKIINFGIFGD